MAVPHMASSDRVTIHSTGGMTTMMMTMIKVPDLVLSTPTGPLHLNGSSSCHEPQTGDVLMVFFITYSLAVHTRFNGRLNKTER